MVSYLDTIPPELRSKDRKEEIAWYLRNAHGDIEDAKIVYLFLGRELGFDVTPELIRIVTDEHPSDTFT